MTETKKSNIWIIIIIVIIIGVFVSAYFIGKNTDAESVDIGDKCKHNEGALEYKCDKCKEQNADKINTFPCQAGYNCINCGDTESFSVTYCRQISSNEEGNVCLKRCDNKNNIKDYVPYFECLCDDDMNPCPGGYTCDPIEKRCTRLCKTFPEDCRCDEDNECPDDYECDDGRCIKKKKDDDDDDDDDEEIPDDNFCLNNQHTFNFFTGELINNECRCTSLLYDDEKGCSPFIQHIPQFKKLFKKMDDENFGDFSSAESLSVGGETRNYLIRYIDKRALKQAAFMDRFPYFDNYIRILDSRGGNILEDFFDRLNINTPERFHVTKDNYWYQLVMDNAYYNICNQCRSRSSGCIDSLCQNSTYCGETGFCECDKDTNGNDILDQTFIGKRCDKIINCNRDGTDTFSCDGTEYPLIAETDIDDCSDSGCGNIWSSYPKNPQRFDISCEKLCCNCKEGYTGKYCDNASPSESPSESPSVS